MTAEQEKFRYVETLGGPRCGTCRYVKPVLGDPTHGECPIVKAVVSLQSGCCGEWLNRNDVFAFLYFTPVLKPKP